MSRNKREVYERSHKATKQKKITVLLDTNQWKRFEMYCREKGFKKSTLAARLIREHLVSEGFGTKESRGTSS